MSVRAFQQQLAEVAIAGFQPQFNKWVELLTNPGAAAGARRGALWCDDGLTCSSWRVSGQRHSLAIFSDKTV